MRPVRMLAWSGGYLLGLIALLVFLVWFAVATTTGSRLVFSQIERLLDDQLIVGEFTGTISGPLRIQDLQFSSEAIDVSVKLIELDWLPSDLLTRWRVQVEMFRIQGLQVALLERGTPAQDDLETGLPDDLSLPLPLQIDHLVINDVTVISDASESGAIVSLQSIVSDELSWLAGGIEIRQLSIKSPVVDFTADAQLQPEGDWPLSVDALYSLDLKSQQLPNATGAIALSGSLVELDIVQTLDPPYSLRIEASVNEPLMTPKWQGNLWAEGLQLASLDKNLPPVSLTAKVTAQGDGVHANLNADVQAVNSSVQISGSVSFREPSSESPSVDLQLAWQQLIWPLDAKKNYLIASDSGKAHVTGELDAYRATVKAQLAVPAYPSGNIDIAGAGSRHGFTLEQMALSILGGDVLGSASVDWDKGIKARFELSGKNIDPAGLDAKWPGRLSFNTRGEAQASSDGTLTSLQGSLGLDGLLRGKPVTAEMTGHYDEGTLTIPSLALNVLDTTFQAEVAISTTTLQSVNFQWRLSINDLGFWVPGLAGNVRGEGSLTGTVKDPRIQASLSASGVAIAEFQIDHVELTTDLGLGTSPLSFNANLEGLHLGDTEVGQVELDLSGTLARHVLGLRTVRDTGTNRMSLSGALSDMPIQGTAAPIEEWGNSTWQFSFDALDFQEGDIEIDLVKGSQPKYNSRIDGESIAIGDTCFNVSDTSEKPGVPALTQQRICAQATGNYADEINGDITFNNMPLMLLNPLLPAPVGFTGSLGGRISLGWNVVTAKPTATVVLDTSAADLQSINDQGDIKPLLRFEPGKLNANWKDDALRVDIELPLAGSAGIKATATVAPGKGGKFVSRAVDANVIASFDDLDWMADFLQGVTQLSGNLKSDLRIGGTISGPVLVGNLSLKNGKAVLPVPGLTLRELNVDVVGDGSEGLGVIGSVKSGGGTLSLEGQVNNIGPLMTGRMSLSGQRVLILNTPEAEIFASPVINADIHRTHLALAGEVSIDSANIQLTSLPQTAVSVSGDQIIVNTDTPANETETNFDVTTRLHLLLNDAVRFRGFGLDATFGGDLSLIDLPGKPTTANGDINVLQGRYRAYGQNLNIETGKLFFVGGPIGQPGIDVRAVRQVTADIKVGAIARGKLRAPEFTIFSEPSMNQSDQLAYLVLGRPLSTSTSGESSVLSRAALAMGIKGGNYLTEQFGSKLGVDKISIETPGSNANEQAALVVGKYLSPKLFVSYGIGVLDAVSTLKVEYLLSSNWRLVSESSAEEGGIDLTYVRER